MPKLSNRKVQTARPGRHSDGDGLYLNVTANGGRSWVFRYKRGGRVREMGLGPMSLIPLAEAREKTVGLRRQLRDGLDPLDEQKRIEAEREAEAGRRITFDEAVNRYLDVKLPELRNQKHAEQWRRSLQTYASPVIGKLAVADIELAHVVQVLEPIWTTKTETAKRLRQRIEHVLNWAAVRGYRSSDNPAAWKGKLDAVLPKPTKVAKTKHFDALPYPELPAFMGRLREENGMAARALEWAILTAARSGEVRAARWREIDMDEGIWYAPPENTKSGDEHRVPLPESALGVLTKLPAPSGPDSLVFPAPRGGALSDMSLTAVLRRMNVDATVHGFRSTFRDWAAERTNYPNEVIEKSLAHAIGDRVEAAYRRGDLFARRYRLMEDWAAFCDGWPAHYESGEVQPLYQVAT